MKNKELILQVVNDNESKFKDSNSYFFEDRKYNIDKSLLFEICKLFDLVTPVEILYLTFEKKIIKGRFFSSDTIIYYASVFTDEYLKIGEVEDVGNWSVEPDSQYEIPWEIIDSAEIVYDSAKDIYLFRFHYKKSNDYEDVYSYLSGIKEEYYEDYITLINKIAKDYIFEIGNQ